MRVLRLDLPNGEELDLHPYLTVLGGLDAELRRRVADQLSRLARGDASDVSGSIEARGEPTEIDAQVVGELGLAADVDVVVVADQLPGAGQEPAVETGADDTAAGPTELQAALTGAAERVATATAQLADARRSLDDFAISAHDDAVTAVAEAEAAATTALDGHPGAEPPEETERRRLAERLEHQRAHVADLERRLDADRLELLELLETLEHEQQVLDELRGTDSSSSDRPADPVVPPAAHVEAVERALDAVRQGPPAAPLVPSPEAVALADEIAAHHRRHDTLEQELRSEGIDVVALQNRLASARAEVAEAEVAARPKVISAEDDAEIERLHDIVVEQGEKRSSRRGGKGAERAYEEASEALDALLERVGYPTYAAYVMGRISPTVDIDARRRLDQAKALVAELEAELDQAGAVLERDSRVLVLRAERDQLWAAARDLLGTLPDDVESALRDVRIPGDVEHPALDDLHRTLLDIGVDDPGRDETALVAAAETFLADAAIARSELERRAAVPVDEDGPQAEIAAAEQRVAALRDRAADADAALTAAEREHARAQEDTAELESALAAATEAAERLRVEQPEPGTDPRVAADPRVVVARDALARAEARLARHHAAAEEVDRLHAALREAREQERAAQAALDAARGGAPSTVALDAAGVDEISRYLVSRADALEAGSSAETVPLVLDEALDGLPDDAARQVCDTLARVGPRVQVIYLGDAPAVAAWAREQGLDVAAVVRPGQPAI